MGTINALFQAVDTIKLREQIPNLILATAFEITALNQLQMYEGKLSTGEDIKPDYSGKFYAKLKASLNPLPGYGTPDAFLKGNLYKAMGVSVEKDSFDIESTVEYAVKLVGEYGDNLFRLSDKHKTEYAQGVLLDAIKQYILEKTGLHFN